MPGFIFDEDNNSVASSNGPALITSVDNLLIANIFCVGAFMDKHTGVVYNDCTGEFPFMSLNGNVFFCDVPLQN